MYLEKNEAERNSPIYFVTVDRSQDGWRGYWTVGQHAYMWTSADVGDAYLHATGPRLSASEALATLKTELSGLFSAMLA